MIPSKLYGLHNFVRIYRGSLITPIPVSVHYFDAFKFLTNQFLRPYTNISSNTNSQNTNPMQNLLQNNPDLLRHLLLLRKYAILWPSRKISKKKSKRKSVFVKIRLKQGSGIFQSLKYHGIHPIYDFLLFCRR